jgi:type IV pilus assembly protein PilM
MAKQGGPVVGIDLGSNLIKVVEARQTKTGVQVSGLAIAPTPDGVIENGVIVNPATLGAAIKKLLNEHGIKARQCVSAVSGQSSVVLRVIEVPKMSGSELAETMKWEVERHVPFSSSEVVMDFQPLEKPNEPADAQNMEVLLAVAQQDMVNSHVETLLLAGLKPIAIDVEPLAAGRALIEMTPDGAKEQTVGILNIGALNTDLGIFENGMLTFPNPPLPVAGINITRAISESLGESEEQAEKLKKELAKVDLERTASGAGAPDFGAQAPSDASPSFETVVMGNQAQPESPEEPASGNVPVDLSDWSPAPAPSFTDTIDGPVFDLGGEDVPPEPVAPVFDLSDDTPLERPMVEAGAQQSGEPVDLRTRVSDAVAPVLVDLATELRRSLDYYRTRYQNQPQVIFLSGGTARLPNLDKFLSNELGVPVVVANPLANVKVTSSRYSAAYLNEVSPLFSISIGLAVRDMLE